MRHAGGVSSIPFDTSAKAVGKFRRACPALNAYITPTDCGVHRGRAVACPAECPFHIVGCGNPLRLSTAQSQLLVKILNRSSSDHREAWDSTIIDLQNQNKTMTQETMSDYVISLGLRLLLYTPGADGRSTLAHWEEEGWTGLTSDDVVMIRYTGRAYCTLIEIRKVHSDDVAEGVDLLAPGSPVLLFREIGAFMGINRFDRFLVWVVPFPGYCNLFGVMDPIPLNLWRMVAERIEAGYAGALAHEPGLAKHTYVSRESYELQKHILAAMNAAESALALTRASNEAYRQALESRDDYLEGESAASSAPGLSPDEIRAKLEAFELTLADVCAKLEKSQIMWLDLPHPQLDQKTPREAAAIPELRDRLVDAVKAEVYFACSLARRIGLAIDPYGDVIRALDLKDVP